MEIVNKKLSELHLNPKNPRKNDNTVDFLINSIREFGFKQPLVIDESGMVLVGNTRLKAAKKMGLDSVPCVIATDLTPEKQRAYALADNKLVDTQQ